MKPAHMMMSTIFFLQRSRLYLHLNNCEKDKQLLVSPPHDYTHTQCPTTHTWDMSTHLMVNGLLYLLPDFTTTLPSLSLKSRETMYSKTFTYLEVNSCKIKPRPDVITELFTIHSHKRDEMFSTVYRAS